MLRVRAIRRFTVQPVLPEPLLALGDLAGNLRWSWHPETQDVFAAMDADAWEAAGRDPVKFLGAVSSSRLQELAADEGFLARLGAVRADLENYLTGDRWYQTSAEATAPKAIGYFSPEFGITAVLPQYSGGLGILAGDHLKAASDLGVPLVGVGLLYRHGYFRQFLSRDGWQQERYPVLDPDGLPLSLLREQDGSVAKVVIGLPGDDSLTARVWVAHVGRVPLLLLDTDVEENSDVIRDVTDRLYGGDTEHRLRQEMLLGIGGVRALRAYSRITGAPAPRSSTPTRATPASSASSASASSSRTGQRQPHASTRRSRCPAPARCSPRTPRCRPASTASRASSSSSTSAARTSARAPGRADPRARRGAVPRAATRPCSTWP